MDIGDLKCPPLYGTRRSPDRPTLGGRIAEVARNLGKPLMSHQRYICDVAFEILPETGYFAYSQVVVIGPRQNTGKTELLLPKMTWRCIGMDRLLTQWIEENLGRKVRDPGPQNVIYTAQNADETRKKWRRVHLPRLESSKYRTEFVARRQAGHELFVFRNGSMWGPTTGTSKGSGTGDSIDDATIDEAWAQPDSTLELGLRPAMQTRPWRQLWIASMIPGPTRLKGKKWDYLQTKRQAGRARVDTDTRRGTAFFDWTARPGADPGDPATWWSCCPGLGYTVPSDDVIAEDYDQLPLEDFCAEYLGWESTHNVPRWTLITRETWQDREDPSSYIDDGAARALALEIDEERRQAWIGVVGMRWDNDYHVALAEPGYRIMPGPIGIEWVEPRLLDLIEELKPCTVVIDPRRPAASYIQPLKNRGIDVTTPQAQQVAAACGRFYDATGQDAEENVTGKRMWHLGQQPLDRALSGARKYDVGEGAFVFVRKGADSALCPLYAVVLAMHGVDVKGVETTPIPDIFV